MVSNMNTKQTSSEENLGSETGREKKYNRKTTKVMEMEILTKRNNKTGS